jgi:hypothetical protein
MTKNTLSGLENATRLSPSPKYYRARKYIKLLCKLSKAKIVCLLYCLWMNNSSSRNKKKTAGTATTPSTVATAFAETFRGLTIASTKSLKVRCL